MTHRRRAAGAGPRRVDVALDDDAADGGEPPDQPTGDPAPAPVPRGRAWWVTLAVVVVLVVAQVVADARDRARVAAASRVPGVVRALDGPADVRWRAAPGTRLAEAARVGEVVVAPLVAADHGVALVGLDAATGATLWRSEVAGARPAWDALATVDPVPCAPVPPGTGLDDGATTPALVLCLVTDGGTDVREDVRARVPVTTARVVVVEAAGGRVVLEREVPTPVTSVLVNGSQLLLVGADDDLHVRSQGLVDGHEGWHVTRRLDVPPPDGRLRATLLDAGTLAVDDGRAATLLTTQGRVLRTVGTARPGLRTGQQSGSRVAPSPALGAVAVGNRAGTVLATRDRDLRLTGSPMPVVADDGSVPGLVLTRTPRVRAWDARDGSLRWEATVVDALDVTVLRGRVHLGTASAVVTFDAASGEELWRVRRPSATSSPVTDGRHLYVLAMRDGRHRAPYDLVALHLADGSEAWRVPAPVGAVLTGAAGLLVATGDEAVEVLG